MAEGGIAPIVTVVADGAARFLKGVREALAPDREYGPEEVADWVAATADGSRSDSLSAEVHARSEGGDIVVTVRFRDPVFGRAAPTGRTFRFRAVDDPA